MIPSASLMLVQQATLPLSGDSVRVVSPLPGGAAAVARFLFSSVPQWLQIIGVFIGAAVVFTLLWFAWKNRLRLGAWFGARSSAWKLGFAAIVLVLVGGMGAAGLKTWNFMMHDNGFCTGCHVMNTAFQRFTASEHSKLLCHDCHRQGMVANVRQLYSWVAERPDRIGMHAPVPNETCNECHVQHNADSVWKRISATAGHQVHLNPRSPAFKALSCVTCHGKEIHRFKASDLTCKESGCHDKVSIQLGKMAGQTQLHCLVCHQFTAAAIESNPLDSARAAMVPVQKECLSCHQMQERMKSFSVVKDPHNGNCGLCHNPHTQTTPFGAYQSCATSNCHANADTLTAMHKGLGDHTLQNCGACHTAHTWKVSATDCRGCHKDVDLDKLRTRRGARRSSDAGMASLLLPVAFVPRSRNMRIRFASPRRRAVAQQRPDTTRFRHSLHKTLDCATCHGTAASHGALKPGIKTGCMSCHHANNDVGNDCTRCHTPARLAPVRRLPVVMALSVTPAPRTRTLGFAHATHVKLECARCHASDLTRTVQTTCADCHADHHAATRTCASCHPTPPTTVHTRQVHVTGCSGSGCHTRETSAAITPARAVCVACHARQTNHKPGRDCATCHLTTWSSRSASSP